MARRGHWWAALWFGLMASLTPVAVRAADAAPSDCVWTTPVASRTDATKERNDAANAVNLFTTIKGKVGEKTELAKLADTALASAVNWAAHADEWITAAASWASAGDTTAASGAKAACAASKDAKKAHQDATDAYKAEAPDQMEIEAKKAEAEATKALEELKKKNDDAEKAGKSAPVSSRVLSAAEIVKSRASAWSRAAKEWKDALATSGDDGAAKIDPAAKEKAAKAAKTEFEEAKKQLLREQDLAAKASEPETSTENFYIHAGLVSLTPFEIKYQKPQEEKKDEAGNVTQQEKDAAFYLDKSGLAARGYVEARFRRRQAWEDARLPPEELAKERIEAERAKVAWAIDAGPPATNGSASEPAAASAEQAKLKDLDADLARVGDPAAATTVDKYDGGWGFSCLRHDLDVPIVEGVIPSAPTRDRLPSCLLQNFDARFGYTFNADSEATGATVVGSGDVNASVAWGIPLFNTTFPVTSINLDGSPARISTTINLETMYEAITDRGVLDIHDRWVIGGSWALGMLLPPLKVPGLHDGETLRPRVFEFAIRGGWSEADVPYRCGSSTDGDIGCTAGPTIDLDTGDSTGQTRSTIRTKDGLPAFRSAKGGSLDIDISLPFGETGYAVMNSTLLLGSELGPNPWSFRLGLTIPFEKLLGVLPNVLSQ